MRNVLRATTVLLLILALAPACTRGLTAAPTIQVSPSDVNAGSIVRVTGTGWKAGERITIALKTPEQATQQAQSLTDALVSAAGGFAAVFAFPRDKGWTEYRTIAIVAYSIDWARTAQAIVHQGLPATGTPLPVPTQTIGQATPAQVQALGYVENVVSSSGVIKLRLVEGNTDVVVVTTETLFAVDGGAAQLSNLNLGDLIEAIGQKDASNRLQASQVRILVQSTAMAPPSPTPAPVAPTWRGQYYDNTTFSGQPGLTREDPVINFQWRDGAPAPGFPTDSFAVRWTGTWSFETGVYRFFAQVDDGVRLSIGQQIIMDQWHDSTGALYTTDVYLTAGPQTIRVEYFDGRSNALARIWWEYIGPDAAPVIVEWKGAYYRGMSLAGSPLVVVSERAVDFNWGSGAPFDGFPVDEFSARWTRVADLSAGVYRFSASADDGVRVTVDGAKVIDRWRDGSVETFAGDVPLAAGTHAITVEYYEHTGQAMIRVWWELLPNTPTATSMPSPTATATPVATLIPLPTWTATATIPVYTRTPAPRLPTRLPTEAATPTSLPRATDGAVRPSADSLYEVFVPQVNRTYGMPYSGAAEVRQGDRETQSSLGSRKHFGGYVKD
jgi:hypothetical protein